MRFALLNIVTIGLLTAIYLQGWLVGALVGFTKWLSLGICAVFVFGFVLCAAKIWRTGRELDAVRQGSPLPTSRAGAYLESISGRGPDSRYISANLLRIRLVNHIGVVRHTANSLVFLGLVGTVIGFIVALSSIDPETSVEVDNVAAMVGTLITGMSIALYTTLVGAVLHLWLMINHRMLSTGTARLFDAIVELGEDRVGV
jgi:hypothetical protein